MLLDRGPTVRQYGPMRTPFGRPMARYRRDAIVGRRAELSQAHELIAGADRPDVIFLHGPGGVGKTALMLAIEGLAHEIPRPTVWLDGADIEPSPTGFMVALRQAIGADPHAALADALPSQAVLFIDRFEVLAQLSTWLWRDLTPNLPPATQLIIAGRLRAPARWLDESAFGPTLRVLPVRNLAPADAAELLHARGIQDLRAVESLVRETYGHPLAIMIAAEEHLARHGAGSGTTGPLLDHPDAAARLLGRFLDEAVEPRQRDALHVCGHARRTDRALLREVLDIDNAEADDLLAWLRDRPYAESHPDGVAMHEIVRDALDHDLRWRDAQAYTELHGRIRAVVVARMQRLTGPAFHTAAMDLLHLHRANPRAASLFVFDQPAPLRLRSAASEDSDAVVRLYGEVEGRARGTAARYWLRHQPQAGYVAEDGTGAAVAAAIVARLDALADPALVDDPVVGWLQREIDDRRPRQPGETVLHQFVVDSQSADGPGPLANVIAGLSLRLWAEPSLGWCVLSTAREATWSPVWTYIGFERLGTCLMGGVEIAVWARDFGRGGYASWLDALMRNELDQTEEPPAPVASPVTLAYADFAAAVQRLTRDLHAPERILASPLLGSHLAGEGSDPRARAGELVRRVQDAVAELERRPRLALAARAVDRTYLRPAATQARAAEVLGLPFSTYRRHLRRGVEQLVEVLWAWELHGVPATDEPASKRRMSQE